MNGHFGYGIVMLRSVLGLAAVFAIIPAAIAQEAIPQDISQNPAELIPPAPSASTTTENGMGSSLGPSLSYGNSANPFNSKSINAQSITGYRVFIPADNPTILERAKAIEPTAFVQTLDGQKVIQVGLFGTEALALQQVARFQEQGMPVKFQPVNQILGQGSTTTVPMSDVPLVPATVASAAPSVLPPTPNYPALPNYSSGQPQPHIVNTVSPGYYVVIPTALGDANYVQSQLNQLGIPLQYIFLRDRPLGVHYAIGTFSKRSEADRLSAIVRNQTKFDARVYYER